MMIMEVRVFRSVCNSTGGADGALISHDHKELETRGLPALNFHQPGGPGELHLEEFQARGYSFFAHIIHYDDR